MALIQDIELVQKERHSTHAVTDCSYSVFSAGGKTYLQLDTYGSSSRKLKGKVSQTLQMDEVGARKLKHLIEEAFPDLR